MRFNIPKIERDVNEGVSIPYFAMPSILPAETEVRTITIETPDIQEQVSLHKVPTLLLAIKDIRLSDCKVTTPALLTPKIQCCGEGTGSSNSYIYNYDVDDILWKGEWDVNLSYFKGSQVRYKTGDTESAYIAIQDVPAGVLPTTTAYWDLHLLGFSSELEDKLDYLEEVVNQTRERVTLKGDTSFSYYRDIQETVDKEEILLVASEFNIKVEPIERIWEYSYDGGFNWTRIPNTYNKLSYTLRHDSNLFRGSRSLTIRYTVREVSAQITIVKLYSATSPRMITVTSDFGDTLFPGNMETTLRAVVSYGDQIITDTIDAYRFNWYRISGDPEDDIAWNLREGRGVKEVNIDDSEVNFTAYFYCEID